MSTSWSSLRVVRRDFPHPDGSVLSAEWQTTVNGHGRRTRRRPWRSTRVSLVVLRDLRPPEESGTEPFSERVRQAVRVTPAGACSMHACRGHDLKFEEGSSPPPAWCACAACIACSARTRSRLRTPCSNSPASRGVQWSRTGVKFRGPIHASPSGSLPRPFGPRGSVLVKIASRQHASSIRWLGFCAEYRRIFLARRLPRCRRHRSRLFVHRVLYLTKRDVREPERGRQTVVQEDKNHARCTSSSGPWRRWLNKSPNGVAAMPSRVLRSVMRSVTTRTSRE